MLVDEGEWYVAAVRHQSKVVKGREREKEREREREEVGEGEGEGERGRERDRRKRGMGREKREESRWGFKTGRPRAGQVTFRVAPAASGLDRQRKERGPAEQARWTTKAAQAVP